MARTRRHAGVLSTLLAVAVTLVGLIVVVTSLLGFHLYAIATGSMAGTLDPGTLAIAREVPVGELTVGDVITDVPPAETGISHPVTHRIIDIDDTAAAQPTFTTKGDANATNDPWTFQLSAPPRLGWSTPCPFSVVRCCGSPTPSRAWPPSGSRRWRWPCYRFET